MTIEQIAQLVVDAYAELDISVMIVGSLSSNYYGIARSTQDADLVVQTKPGDIQKLATRLSSTFLLKPQPSFESVTFTMKYLFEVKEHAFFVEMFELSEDPHDLERFARRLLADWDGKPVWLPTAEDVIVTKLRWYTRARRGKDWDDIRDVISVQQARLDWDYIHRWCEIHGSREHLDAIRESLKRL